MSRRVVFLIALISLAVLGAAAAPWTLTGSGLSSAVTEHMKERYGLELKAEGRSTFALLPIPRVKFENVTIRFPGKALEAEGGTLRGELRLLPMVLGRVELAEVSLSEANITASSKALQGLDWAGLAKARPDDARARRLILAGATVRWTDLEDAKLDRVNLVVSWADADSPLYAVGSAVWQNETVLLEQASLTPSLLASDQISPVSLILSAPSGRIAVTGEAQLGDDPRMTGESTIEAKSVRDFTHWSGVELPFGSLVRALSVAGDFSMHRRRLTWPSVAVTLGKDKLEGTMAVRFEAERPIITGTLAAGTLNLSDLFVPFKQARNESGAWSSETIDLAHTTGSSLDLRLSASSAQLGRLRLDDMAASVLVRPGRIEASIGRADFHKGTLKGRLSLIAQGKSVEFKSQGTFSGVDVSTFLAAIGEPRWLTGAAQGQFQLEGSGKTPAEVMRHAQGRSSVTVKEGELVGLALDDALRRVEKRPLLASLNWKSGRTAFDQAQAQLVVEKGIGKVLDTRLTAPTIQAGLDGQVSLVDRALSLKAHVSQAGASPDPDVALEFDITGGWDSVTVMPDVRSLIKRSGAAKPLFGRQQLIQPSSQNPLATAQ
ncbi:AsmA family protein [Microvirga roseola]|uniref:AsmA family protein n=1 Tax=Microvirga roseola TaxID=2883126 RepID=UPI001E56FA4F|nr:AsmA-like C-terminal region-containing protein [Microvirga roseola]